MYGGLDPSAIDALGPHAQAVVRAMPGKHALPASRVGAFLSVYTNFLVRAGKANRAYLQDVLLRGQSAGDTEQAAAVDSELPVLARLDALTQEIPAGENALAEEISQAATALIYYVTSGEIDSSIQWVVVERVGVSESTVYPHEPSEPLGAGAPACRCHPNWCHGIRGVPQQFGLSSMHVFRSQNVQERGPAESSARGVRPRTRHRHGLDRWVLADRR
jgi:hypothetical protein